MEHSADASGHEWRCPGVPRCPRGDPSPPEIPVTRSTADPSCCPPRPAGTSRLQPQGLSPHAWGLLNPLGSLSPHARAPSKARVPHDPSSPSLRRPRTPHTRAPPSSGTPPPPGPRIRSSLSPGRVLVPSLTAAPPPRPSAPRSRPVATAASPRPAPARFPLADAHATPGAAALIGRIAQCSIGCGAGRAAHDTSRLAEREVGGADGERAVTCPSGLAGPAGSRGRKRK